MSLRLSLALVAILLSPLAATIVAAEAPPVWNPESAPPAVAEIPTVPDCKGASVT